MKKWILSFAILTLSLSSWAGRSENFKTNVTGVVVFERKNTKACAEKYCPPSRPYYQATLIKAQIDGFGPVKKVDVLDLTSPFDLKAKPEFLMYKGVRVREGMKISVNSYVQVTVFELSKKTYASLLSAGTVKVLK